MNSVLYIESTGIGLFVGQTQTLYTLKFDQTVVRDKEVVNKDELQAFITSFIETNKIPSLELLIVIGDDLFFSQDFDYTQDRKVDGEKLNSFLDLVPFEHIQFQKIPLEKDIRVLATNKDLYAIVLSPFEKKGFVPAFIIPFQITGLNNSPFDATVAVKLLEHAESFRQHTMVSYEEKTEEKNQKDKDKSVIQHHSRFLPILFGAFFLLITILVFLLMKDSIYPPGQNPAPKSPLTNRF